MFKIVTADIKSIKFAKMIILPNLNLPSIFLPF